MPQYIFLNFKVIKCHWFFFLVISCITISKLQTISEFPNDFSVFPKMNWNSQTVGYQFQLISVFFCEIVLNKCSICLYCLLKPKIQIFTEIHIFLMNQQFLTNSNIRYRWRRILGIYSKSGWLQFKYQKGLESEWV